MEGHVDFFHMTPLRNSIYETNPPLSGGEYKILVEASVSSVGGLFPVLQDKKTRRSIFLATYKEPVSEELTQDIQYKVKESFKKVINKIQIRNAPAFSSRRARWGWRTVFHHARYGGFGKSSPFTAFARAFYKSNDSIPQGIENRLKENIECPPLDQWMQSHKKLMSGHMPVRLKSFCVEFLNRTLVSRNKLYKFNIAELGVTSSICELCNVVANTEHALFECKFPQFCAQTIADFLDAEFHKSVPWISVNKRNLFLYSCFIDEIPTIHQYEIILFTVVMKSKFLYWSANNKWKNWSRITYSAQILGLINRAIFILKSQNKNIRILDRMYDHLAEVLIQ